MDIEPILRSISRGRTDYVYLLLEHTYWQKSLTVGNIKPLQWFVYYGDVTALRAILKAGGTLDSINLDEELGNAAFFGHWKVCDFLLHHGADVNYSGETGETALHSALAKAGRPYYSYVVRLLLENGAQVNAKTKPGFETGAFMRDVRTRGETPLHRAAAYADIDTIQLLLDHGADKEAKDAHGSSPLTWASEHLRPGAVLSLLAYGDHRIGQGHVKRSTSDHGHGWGNSMDWNLLGDYLPEDKE